MLRATLKSLLSRKLRLLLSGLAVVLATMFVSGAFVLTDTLGRSFDALFSNAYNYVDVSVSAKPALGTDGGGDNGNAVPQNINASVVDEVAKVDGVRRARGQVGVDGARVVGKNGKVVAGTGPPRFGIAWNGDSELLKLREGRGPQAPDEIVINKTLATTTGYRIGDQVGVLTLQPKKTFTLVGIFGYAGGRDSLGGELTVGFTEPVAQELMLGKTGVYNSIDVKINNSKDTIAVRDSIRRTLGPAYTVDTGKDLAKKASDAFKPFLSGFNTLLLAFAVIALLVGIFLILNTFSIIVAQRTRELALLRAMGARRGQVIRSVLLESAIVGVLASAIGYAVGIGLGAGGAFLLTNFFGGLEVASVGTPVAGAVLSFVLGIAVTMISALLPALRAARVAPIAAMREAATPDRPLTRLTVGGGIVFLAGAGTLAFGLSGKAHGNTLTTILVGVGVTFVGVALLTPLLSRPAVAILGRLFSWSLPGQLGRRNSARNPRRTAITAAAMMIGIALITAISTVFSSLTASVNKIVDQQLQADLVIAGQQSSALPPTIDPAALDRVRALPGVATLAADSYESAKVNGKQTYVASYDDLGAAVKILKMKTKDGSIGSLDSGEIVLDDKTAKKLGVGVGSTLAIQLPRTPEGTYRVKGVFRSAQIGDGIILPWSDAKAGFRSALPVQAFAKVADGTSVSSVRKQVDDILKDSPEVSVQTRSEYVGQSTQIFNVLLGVVQVLLFVALLIAVLGIVNTLILSVLERTRELGLLRAIGLRRSQMMRMITVEAVVISLFGALLGIGVGVGLGAAVVRALKDQGFTQYAFPWVLMAVYLVAAAVVGVVAAVVPAIRAARLNVLNAIAYE
jgi:putative ABC transport system permease protein